LRNSGSSVPAGIGLALAFSSQAVIPYTINPESLGMVIVPIVFLFGIGLWLLLDPPSDVRLNPVALAPLLLLPALFLNIRSDWPVILGLLLSFWICLIAGMSLKRTRMRQFSLVLGGCLAAISLVGMLHWAFGGATGWTILGLGLTMDHQGRLIGPFPNPNILADVCAAAWLLLWLTGSRSDSGSDKTTVVLAIVLGSAIVATASRGGLLVWLLAILLAQWISPRSIRQILPPILASLLIGIALQSLFATDTSQYAERLVQTYHEGLGERLDIWASAFCMWLDHPWLGVGFGRFGSHFLDAQAMAHRLWPDLTPGLGTTTSAHNILLQLMAEAGVPGLILWIGITALLLRTILRDRDAWHAIPMAAAAILWAGGLIHITLIEPYPLLLFALFLGAGSGWMPSRRGIRPALLATASLAMALLMIPSGLRATEAWAALPAWMNAKQVEQKRELANILLGWPQTAPYFVSLSASMHLDRPDLLSRSLRELDRAWAILQTPELLKARILAYEAGGRMDEACALRERLMHQGWAENRITPLRKTDASCMQSRH